MHSFTNYQIIADSSYKTIGNTLAELDENWRSTRAVDTLLYLIDEELKDFYDFGLAGFDTQDIENAVEEIAMFTLNEDEYLTLTEDGDFICVNLPIVDIAEAVSYSLANELI